MDAAGYNYWALDIILTQPWDYNQDTAAFKHAAGSISTVYGSSGSLVGGPTWGFAMECGIRGFTGALAA